MEWNQQYITALTTWRKNRVRNYAAKKEITFTAAVEFLQLSHFSNEEIVKILDAVCDPEFHSSKQPEIPF